MPSKSDTLDEQIEYRIRGLKHMVGNSPVLEVRLRHRGKDRVIYAKAENLNMTGSIKDRMALHIVRQGYLRDLLEPGAPIIEATNGVGRFLRTQHPGVKVHPLEPAKDGFASPRVTLLGFGAFKRVCRTCCDPGECGMPDLIQDADVRGHAPPCPLWQG